MTIKHLILVAILFVPGLAVAAPAAAAAPADATGPAAIITAIAALLSAVGAAVAAMRSLWKAKKAEAHAAAADGRAAQALAWADRLSNAHEDGVVLVLSYPGTLVSSRSLLETNGWKVCAYSITQAELDAGALLPGGHVISDVCAADAVVIEGLDEAGMARLAAVREFRDNIRAGAGVSMFTGGRNYRYDLTLWGMCDQGVTTPVTTEAAVRGSLARRAATARIQGVRPGRLAETRQALIGAAPAPATN